LILGLLKHALKDVRNL